MAGWDRKEGIHKYDHITDDEIWSAFSSLFSSKSKKTTSYKYVFFKSVLDNLYNVDQNLELSFDQLFSKFGEICWNLVLKYHIKQMLDGKSKLEQILKNVFDKYQLPEGIPYESLSAEQMCEISHQVKVQCKNNVIGALFEDTKQLFYSFSIKDEYIRINPLVYAFICRHKLAIEKINYYEWARFLEAVNRDSSLDHVLTKIDESTERSDLSYYRDILFKEFENRCFYCGKKVSVGHVQVDHFVPWSFVKDDNLWNFVLACPDCNNSKRDHLASKNFLDQLLVRNRSIIASVYPEMKNYREKLLISLYSYAANNGFDENWSPSRFVVNS